MTRLEFLRRKSGMTQAQLAAAILYSRPVICVLEHRQPKPDDVGIRVRAALERYFGEPFERLMEPVE